jgi:large subunit ribosomal protein L21
MYAIIRAGGRQYRISPGDRIYVDLLDKEVGEEISYRPLLVVTPGGEVVTGDGCDDWTVTARILGTAKGPKIRGFKYKPKTGYRRRWGHRQRYTVIEIASIGDYTAGKSEEPRPDDEAEAAGEES